jgi:hypothetical protein
MIGRPFDRLRSGVAHVRVVLESPQDFDRQIVSHLYLTRQSQVVGFVVHAGKSLNFRFRFGSGITINNFNAASRAARVSAAPMQYIYARIHDSENEPPSCLNIGHAYIFNCYLRHIVSLMRQANPVDSWNSIA